MDPVVFRESLLLKDDSLKESVPQQIMHALDTNALLSLHGAVSRQKLTFPEMREISLGISGHATLDFLVPVIEASAWRYNLSLSTLYTGYDQLSFDALNPVSEMRETQNAYQLVWLDSRKLLPEVSFSEGDETTSLLDDIWSGLESILAGLANADGAPHLLVTNLVLPADSSFGSEDRNNINSNAWLVDSLNRKIEDWVKAAGHSLLNIEYWSTWIGRTSWFDVRNWNSGKMPFALKWLPFVGDLIARTIARLEGQTKKCLVLDLDNTLWSGVVGDDGVDGIEVGEGSAEGEAHLSVQRFAMGLRKRGVILAVCSKNDRQTALSAFNQHPGMLLKESHFAAFEANWDPKPENLKAIAEQLNIGTDSLVFLDDNPAERGHVRIDLPEVSVPEVGTEVSDYVAICQAAGYFEKEAITADDRKRADYYQANADRSRAKSQFKDLTDYLRSLEMEMTFRELMPVYQDRAIQLLNRSNQFNLTTRRLNEADFQARLEKHPQTRIYTARLKDKWGDSGLISVLIIEAINEQWVITDWVMSCRVINRGVEQMILNQVAKFASDAGVEQLVGQWKMTQKNSLVADLYTRIGFEMDLNSDSENRFYHLDLIGYNPADTAIKIASC